MASASPLSIAPSSFWDGNDGSWNSFIVQVGTPAQQFRVFPSTAGQEAWIPSTQGCLSSEPSNCPYLRGALPFEGDNSTGFKTNASSTWDIIGLYTLISLGPSPLDIGGNGLFGFDTVVWGNGTDSVSQTHEVVAGIADKSVFVGVFGLGPRESNFTNLNRGAPSFLSGLASAGRIPSLSWAYTAGATYRDHSPASLTLGGYDVNRFQPSNINVPMNPDDSRSLRVAIMRILGVNTLIGAVNLLPEATYHAIDSTVAQIWIPDSAIDSWVSAFGLTYDNKTDLFLINSSIRSRLLDLQPTITFALASTTLANDLEVQNIELPYAAFDLQASWPIYGEPTYYFPIRRAMNDTQYTIGRTLLQEVYIIADFERSNFTVAQARFDMLNSTSLVSIAMPANGSNTASNGTAAGYGEESKGLSTASIVGVVLAIVAALAVSAAAFVLVTRRRKRKMLQDSRSFAEVTVVEKSDVDSKGANMEIVAELSGPEAGELHNETHKWGPQGVQELSGSPLGNGSGFLELPGSDGKRHELLGSDLRK